MYGLLIEAFRSMVLQRYGEDMWERILKMAEVEEVSFDPHEIYTEGTITRLAESASKVVNVPLDELMTENGRYFMGFLSQYNYDAVLKVLGRDLRDFLNGLDNLHEYLRFTYPKLKPPSFFCVNESRTGITLQYRSRRTGFISYVQGMIIEIAKVYFNTKMTVEMVSETSEESVWNYVMRLHFDNKSYEARDDHMPVPSEVFFEVFPFNIVFNRGLKVVKCGRATQQAVPGIQGSLMHEVFMLVRPLIEFTWEAVMLHTNNVFEIAVVEKKDGKKKRDEASRKRMSSMTSNAVKFRGQMKYMEQWDAIVFLGTPIMRDVSVMANLGLFINDLSMHDSSRDLVLAGDQQSAELKEALEAEEAKSRQLEESMRKLDEEMKRTDELLYQMIPKGVAERLRSGTSAIDTCETFDDVTVLFSDVVGFTNISSKLQPLQVVDMLNGMYSVFDELTEKHKVYKVETIGDAYMIVSGCPTVTKFHAAFVAEMGLDMVKNIVKCVDPTGQTQHLRIRVGAHSGMVVAGIVGLKMPRYCLFGDTVNTASRMESDGTPMRVHVSETTRKKLDKYGVYNFADGKEIQFKSNTLKTYFLEGRGERDNPQVSKFVSALERERRKMDTNVSGNQSVTGERWDEIANSRATSRMSGTATPTPGQHQQQPQQASIEPKA